MPSTAGLFEDAGEPGTGSAAPLAERMRPATFDEFVGQEHILAEDKVLRRSIEADRVPSLLFWGPPGSGKTTLARLIATTTRAHFEPVSAVSAGVADLRKAVKGANDLRSLYG
ncbi:MAG: AAA family ATPase, partial [Acidobacteria bacterium]|nr:AAA family ATPase [Acidobacteriota bacterium]